MTAAVSIRRLVPRRAGRADLRFRRILDGDELDVEGERLAGERVVEVERDGVATKLDDVEIAARIDDGRASGCLANEQRAVLLERRDGDQGDFHGMTAPLEKR